MITGNKGEWSEAYVFLRLLGSGRLYAADENLNKLEDMYFPILKIFRKEQENTTIEYDLSNDKRVDIYVNGQLTKSLPSAECEAEANYLFEKIAEGGDRAFGISRTEEFLASIGCHRLSAPSSDKTDISLLLHDVKTGYNSICGFSIKSEIGSAPTLINASKATNFVYRISGLSGDEAIAINNIETTNKIFDRMERVCTQATSIQFAETSSRTFCNNLMLIDSRMTELLSHALLYHYRDGLSTCEEVVRKLEYINPLGFPRYGFYEYKFKKFLCAAALGMTPASDWNGIDEANGGYIIVTHNGTVLTYHLYNRAFFETYLLRSTKFERASTKRHEFASIYEDHGAMFINLNLQIRFTNSNRHAIDIAKDSVPRTFLPIPKNLSLKNMYTLTEASNLVHNIYPNEQDAVGVMQSWGYSARGQFVYRGFPSPAAYFRATFTEPDTLAVSPFFSRFDNDPLIRSTLDALEHNYEIIEFEENQYINIRRLRKFGIDKAHINQLCEKACAALDTLAFFTATSIMNMGLCPEIDGLGFGGVFYDSLLKNSPLFSKSHFGKTIIYSPQGQKLSGNDVLYEYVQRVERIPLDTLIENLSSDYGISISRAGILSRIKETTLHYDPIFDAVYKDYETYYADV